MKTIIYDYRDGIKTIPADILQGVIDIIEGMDYSLGKYEIKHFKDDLSDQLMVHGWSGTVRLSTCSSISITSVQRNTGLCTQTGNMARMYADLMKLQAMYLDKKIESAIFVLPTKECANSFGGNVANYDRFLRELVNIFSKVITVPMAIVAFDNEQ